MKRLFFLLLMQLPFSGFGCDCESDNDVRSNWRGADQVFIAVLVRADTSGSIHDQYGKALNLYTLRIVESLKDTVFAFGDYDLRTFAAQQHGGLCDFGEFSPNKRYVIFAYEGYFQHLLTASICGRTGPYQSFTSVELQNLRELGKEFRAAKRAHKLPWNEQHSENRKATALQKLREEVQQVSRKLLWTQALVAFLGFIIIVTLLRHWLGRDKSR